MPLPASGPISMNDVNVELGLSATAQISLNDANVRALFGISSGAISLNDGHSKAAITITDQNPLGVSSAAYRLNSSGLVEQKLDAGSYTTLETWLVAGTNSNFESYVSATGDTGFLTGTLNTWQVLSTSRTWEVTASAGTLRTCTLTVQIRRVSDSTVVDTATVIVSADNT